MEGRKGFSVPAGHLRADYARRALVLPAQHEWVASPQPGVERVMLDREGVESGRATSLVRYAPGSRFPPHRHPLGEEVLVLEGTFSDGEGDFAAGWYLRNPPGSSHQPSSAEGTTIFVKLAQMSPREQRAVRIDTRAAAGWVRRDGRAVFPLHVDRNEEVMLVRLAAREAFTVGHPGGAELLVVAGELAAGAQRCARGSWLRLPPGDDLATLAGEEGATVYLKTGHLARLLVRG